MTDLPREHGFETLEIEGALPEELAGVLYRNGPALLGSHGKRYDHLFDGDGGITAVRFGGGRAEGAVRLVQTAGLAAERAAGRRLFGAYGTASAGLPRPIPFLRVKNAANTSVLLWGGRLFALWEGGRPTEVDPHTLRTYGQTDLGGTVLGTFSAHPHYVASRDASYNFGLRYGRDCLLSIYELPRLGRAKRIKTLALAGPTMMHDFIATDRHLVFFAPPLRLNMLRAMLGLGSYASNLSWRPELGTEIIVVPIDDPDRTVRIEAPPFYQWHFANAYDRDGRVVVDFIHYRDFSTSQWLAEITQGAPSSMWGSTLMRAELDLTRATAALSPLWEHPVEFPRIDPRRCGRQHRFLWMVAHANAAASAQGPADRIVRFDTASGDVRWAHRDPGEYASEPVFVPRPNATAEDDGWALVKVYDSRSHRSAVVVLDGRDPSRELGRAWFDHHIPLTFHGAFLPTAR